VDDTMRVFCLDVAPEELAPLVRAVRRAVTRVHALTIAERAPT
jgi:hypothetical protein